MGREVIEVEAKAEADNELSKVAAWLANVSDDTLIAAAGRLEPYEWELNARMKPPKDIGKVLPKLRELAAKSEWLASALAVKAGWWWWINEQEMFNKAQAAYRSFWLDGGEEDEEDQGEAV